MSIETLCSNCGGRFAATPDLSGQQVSCPSCRKPITVPVSPSAGIVASCQCGQRFEADASLAGQTVACPACNTGITVPFPEVGAQAGLMDAGLDDVLANESAWPSGGLPSMSSGSSWQQPSGSSRGSNDRSIMIASAVGGSLLALFIIGVVIWKALESNPAPQAKANSTAPKESQFQTVPNPTSSTSSPASDDGASTSSDTAPPTPVQPAPVAWKEHSSATGGFVIQMPGSVETSEETTKTKAGTIKVFHESCGLADGSAFDVTYFDLPPDSAGINRDDTLEGILAAYAKSWSGARTREVGFDLGEETGHEFLIAGRREGLPVGIHARIIMIDLRVYQVTWAKPSSNAPTRESEAFVRSFRLK